MDTVCPIPIKDIKVVFFDAGETLVHPYPSFVDLFEDTCAAGGVAVDITSMPEITGMLFAELDARQRGGYTFSTSTEVSRAYWLDFYERLLEGLGHPGMSGLARELYEVFTDPSNYALYEDVRETLEGLEKEGLTLGVISNFEAWLEVLLEKLGVHGHFRHVYISGLVGAEKPHRRIFDLALEGAGVQAGQALHVGDSLISDVGGARSVGMMPVMIDRAGSYADVDCIRITDLRQLLGMFSEKRGGI